MGKLGVHRPLRKSSRRKGLFTSDLKAKRRKRVLGRGNSRCKDLAAREHGRWAEMGIGKRRNQVLGRG